MFHLIKSTLKHLGLEYTAQTSYYAAYSLLCSINTAGGRLGYNELSSKALKHLIRFNTTNFYK